MTGKGLYEFGDFRFDSDSRLLLRDGVTVPLTPKAVDLLLALVERAGQVVDKETLLKTVWPDSFVEENNLADNIFKLRRALGDNEGQRFIETIPKRGYRFVADVRGLEPTPIALVSPATSAVPVARPWPVRNVWLAAGAIALATLLAMTAGRIRGTSSAPPQTLKSSLLPPDGASFNHLALSPEGSWLAFTAATGNRVQLWIRPMADDRAIALEGTDGALYPFWSPDSSHLAFFAGGRLWKVRREGGAPTPLCDAVVGTGGSWNQHGDIVFTTLGTSRVFRVSSAGGKAETILRTQPGQTDFHEPFFLPDGKRYLYLALSNGRKELRGLFAASLDGDSPRRILDHDSNAAFVPGGPAGGYLLLGRNGGLVAQAFDPHSYQLSGEPRMVAAELGAAQGLQSSYRRRSFTASANGMLVYDPRADRQRSQLLWVNRRGERIEELPAALDNLSAPVLSPDGSRVVVSRKDLATNNNDLWLVDARGHNPVRFTFDPGSDLLGIWSPDGQRIVWSSTRNGNFDLYEKEVSGKGQDALLLRSPRHKFATDWSRDGRFLLYREIHAETQHDIYVLPMTGKREPFAYLNSPAMENGGVLSPDGRWIAYASDESGRAEVYVESFPDHGGRRQISPSGGSAPRWRADGRELYYQATDNRLVSVPVSSASGMFATGEAQPLFSFRPAGIPAVPYYSVATDGQRFLEVAVVDTDTRAALTMVMNWLGGRP